MSKRRSLENHYATRLHRTLEAKGLTIEELQYISREDFTTWVNIGTGSIDFADKKLKEMGLTWGNYTYRYYIENRELINPGAKEVLSVDMNEISLENLRKDIIKEVLMMVIREEEISYDETIIKTQCKVAIKYANTLINQLRKGDEVN